MKDLSIWSSGFLASFLTMTSASSSQCPTDFDFNRDVVWRSSPNGKTLEIVNTKAWIETNKGRFNCTINFITAYFDEWQISCANQSTIYYLIGDEEGLFLVDAKGSHYKMNDDLTLHQRCTEDLAIYQIVSNAFQQTFQFRVELEISVKRRKVPRPVGF